MPVDCVRGSGGGMAYLGVISLEDKGLTTRPHRDIQHWGIGGTLLKHVIR